MHPALAFLFGLCLGSFLNVCVYRLPRGRSIVRPRSACPHCRSRIDWRDNIPVLSFLLLGGRCRRCRAPISWRYPAVELATGALAAGLAWRWGSEPAWFAVTLAAASALVALSLIDFDTFFIPDVFSLGLVALGLGASWLSPWFPGGPVERLGWSALGGAAGFLGTWGLALVGEWVFGQEALGFGDVKLLAGVGTLLGWEAVLSSLVIGSLTGSVYGVALMLKGKVGRRDPIPFGPFLSIGALVNLFERLGPTDFLLF